MPISDSKVLPLLEFMVKRGMIDAEDGAALAFWAIKGKSTSPESVIKHVDNGSLAFVETAGPMDFSWLEDMLISGDIDLVTLAKDQDELLSMVNVTLLAKVFLKSESDVEADIPFPENQQEHLKHLRSMSKEDLALRALDEIYDMSMLIPALNIPVVYKVGVSRNVFTPPLSFAGKTWVAVRKS